MSAKSSGDDGLPLPSGDAADVRVMGGAGTVAVPADALRARKRPDWRPRNGVERGGHIGGDALLPFPEVDRCPRETSIQ